MRRPVATINPMSNGFAIEINSMLETRSLMLLPLEEVHSSVPPLLGGRRYFVDPATREHIGFVSDHETSWPARLLPRRLQSVCYEIHEMEDESLLCSYYLRRLPGNRWRVLDADDELVGRLRLAGACSQSHYGQSVCLTLTCVHSPHRLLKMQSLAAAPGLIGMSMRHASEANWMKVGDVCPSETGLLINFLPALDKDPFAKMLLIVGIIVSVPQRSEP
jgi:hypothetical protein